MGTTAKRATLPVQEKTYADYYCQMSYADYLANLEAGTLETADYSMGGAP